MQKVSCLQIILIQSSTTTLDVIYRFVNDLHANEIRVERETELHNLTAFIVTYLFILAWQLEFLCLAN